MSEISLKKRKFIKRNFKRLSVEELTHKTGLKPHVIRSLIEEYTAEMPKRGQDSSVKTKGKSLLTKGSVQIIGVGAIIIFLLTFIVYTPALKNDFVTWDDNEYVYENTNIQRVNTQSLYWMFTAFHVGNWHPLTWLSLTIDYAFWDLDPLGYHLTNIIVHGLNTLLVFFLIVGLIVKAKKIDGVSSPSQVTLSCSAQSLIVASVTSLLFGLHPLHVESVAWVSERKDLLCTFFVLLSILSYLAYTSSVIKSRRQTWFIICLFLFMCALMSKPMAVTLPVILLLLDLYPLKRLELYFHKNLSIFLEKIPFFVLSMASSVVTIIAQHSGGALVSSERLSFSCRLLNALNSLIFYLKKMILPIELVPFYPFPKQVYPLDPQYIISGILVLAITGSCLWMVMRRKYLFFIAWLYYLFTLLPVLGIIQVGDQAAADRYSYLPSISPLFLIGAGVAWIYQRVALMRERMVIRGLVLIFTSLIVFLLGCFTVKQIKIWRNSEILWRYVINAFPEKIPVAHNNLGNAYDDKGMLDEAISEYKKAFSIDPNYVRARVNLGVAYNDKGMFNAAISELKKVISINPNFVEAHYNLGLSYDNKRMLDEAISEYKKALSIDPNYVRARVNLGAAYNDKGMLNAAITEFRKVNSINPNLVEAHYNLGVVYSNKGMVEDAISEFKKTLAINPHLAEAHYRLGIAYYSKGNYRLAIVHCDKAARNGFHVPPKILKALEAYR